MRSTWASLITALWLVLLASGARGQTPADPTRAEAEKLFIEGKNRFLAKDWSSALELLERSHRMYPSPNTLLMLGHCLRELGRPEDAAVRFGEAAENAETRVAAGDASYEKTAAAARKEGAAVRAELALVRVRISPPQPDMRLETPFVRRTLPADGVSDVFHRPGAIVATVTWAGGGRADVKLNLERGRWTTLTVDTRSNAKASARTRTAVPPIERASAEDTPRSKPGWLVPAGIASGAIAAVGFGAFIGFGLKSGSTYEDLESDCGTNCSHRSEDVERGKREQTYANVGLAVGIVGLAAGVTFLVLNAGSTSERKASPAPSLRF